MAVSNHCSIHHISLLPFFLLKAFLMIRHIKHALIYLLWYSGLIQIEPEKGHCNLIAEPLTSRICT